MLRNFLHLLRYCRPYRRTYVVGILALLFVDVLDTFTPKLIQWGIDHVSQVGRGAAASNPLVNMLPDAWFLPGAASGGMWVYFAMFVVVVGVTGLFRYPMSISFARAALTLTHDLRGRFFGHLQRLHAGYHDRSKVGDHMSRATNDMDSVRMFFGVGLLILLDTGLYFVLVPVFMATISWKLLLASLVPLPLIPLIVKKLEVVVEQRWEAVQQQLSTLSERARESFSGAKVVKSFAKEEPEVRSFAKLSREYLRRSLRFAMVASLETPLLFLIVGLADLVVVTYGGHLVIAGEISVGEFAAFFQYLLRLSWPMIGLGWVLMLFQQGRVSMSRIEEILAVEPDISDPEEPAPIRDIEGRVELRGLTFSFGGNAEPALRDVSITVPAGKTLGLVGPVGCGKSALLYLIPRLYDPPPGTVFVDGRDVREIPLDLLRSRIGVVPQDTYLFSETIRENIALGIPEGMETAEGLVEDCARKAGVERDILGIPAGYEALLGERGVNLSGGQRQRVAIARALARRPSILLLDDCLSSVDTETETEILAHLGEAMRETTALVVSHRVSTVMGADEIVVLVDGRIEERGTHEQLLEADGRYAELYRRQQVEGVEGP